LRSARVGRVFLFCDGTWDIIAGQNDMYCIKCGADNLEAAKFCRKCGEPVSTEPIAMSSGTEDAEQETRIAARAKGEATIRVVHADQPNHDAGSEAEIFSISPTLMFVKAGYVLAAIGALLFVAVVTAFTSVSTWLSVLIGLLLFLIPAFYHFKQKLVRYTLTDSNLVIDQGFVARTTRNLPIRRIQDVTIAATVLQRLLGFGNLVIDNASEEGGKVLLKNINTPKHYADELLKQMRKLEQ